MKYYPINLLLEKKRCLVVGAGAVGERKARRLLDCGASVLVIGEAATPGLIKLADKGKIDIKRRKFRISDLKGVYLVIASTDDRRVNSVISDRCFKRGILVNVVDSPDECGFILPSVMSRGDLVISISTGGISPSLAKRIRQDLEKAFDGGYGSFLSVMKKVRPAIVGKMKSAKDRNRFFKEILKNGVI